MIKIPRRTVAFGGAAGAFLLAVDPPANGAAGMEAESPRDRREIEAVFEGLMEAWNAHDMDAFAALFHDDAAWVHWRGGYWKGRAEIKEGHAAVHRTFYRTSQVIGRHVEDLTFLAPNVALVHARDDLTGDERSPGQTFRYRMTLILTKRDGKWRIAAGHNTRMHDDIQ